MGDFKSMLPSLKELGSMTEKLFKDIKVSVGELVEEYKKNRADEAQAAQGAEKAADTNTGSSSEQTEVHPSEQTPDHETPPEQNSESSESESSDKASDSPAVKKKKTRHADSTEQAEPTEPKEGS